MTQTSIATLTAMLSPAFPIGAFSYSHGLEQAISDGRISDAKTTKIWIEALVRNGSGWNDAILISQLMRAPSQADELNDLALALCSGFERQTETLNLGKAFAKVGQAAYDLDLPAYSMPITFALAATQIQADPVTAISLYLQSFASNLISVAVRLVPIGQTDGQIILAKLMPLFQEQAARVQKASTDDLGTSCFAADLASLQHETLQPRIFQS